MADASPPTPRRRRRWIKGLLLAAALLLAVAALFLGGGYALLRGTPDYYHPVVMTDAQRKGAADAAEDTLARDPNLPAGTRSDAIRGSDSAGTAPPPATPATMAGAAARSL